MRKLIIIILVISYILYPFQVFACTGIDKNGRTYYHDHTNTDQTIMPMLYAEKNHLYTKNAKVTDTGFDEDIIISEIFSIPFIQTKESYISYYFDVDEKLKDLYWENEDDLEKIDLKTTVKGIDNILLGQANYKINVGLKNTFQESTKHQKDNTELMFYNIFIKNLNLDHNDNNYLNASKMINNRRLEQIVPEILKIEVEYSITDEDWKNERINVSKLDDKAEIQILSEQKQDNVVAINLSKKLNSNDTISTTYDDKNKTYIFNIEEPGIYTLINSNFDIELFNSQFDDDSQINELYDTNNNNFLIICSIIGTITIIILIIYIVKRKK